MKSKHFSLEERVIEPFHAIRWIFISRPMAILSIVALLAFDFAWLFFHDVVFHFWTRVLTYLVNAISASWTIQDGYWPETSSPLLTIPKLSVPVLAPTPMIWWSFALATIAIWILVGYLKMSLLPIRTITRFMMFLIWITLGCFAIAPMQFHLVADSSAGEIAGERIARGLFYLGATDYLFYVGDRALAFLPPLIAIFCVIRRSDCAVGMVCFFLLDRLEFGSRWIS
jgi:hypothetical protein